MVMGKTLSSERSQPGSGKMVTAYSPSGPSSRAMVILPLSSPSASSIKDAVMRYEGSSSPSAVMTMLPSESSALYPSRARTYLMPSAAFAADSGVVRTTASSASFPSSWYFRSVPGKTSRYVRMPLRDFSCIFSYPFSTSGSVYTGAFLRSLKASDPIDLMPHESFPFAVPKVKNLPALGSS